MQLLCKNMNRNKNFSTLSVVCLLFACLFLPFHAEAQLQVTQGASLPSGWTPDSLVRNVLLGQGVEIYGVQFNGSTGVINCNAIGKFTTGNNPTNLGISEGIIMGTGAVTMAAGSNTSGSSSVTSGCTSYNCPELSAIATSSVNDCAVLEFDFIPRSDSIKFKYVFASEEYPEFVCSSFNDIFGFFLTGVNPNGGMYSAQNIALVPNSTTPISINCVNGGVSAGSATPCILTNSQYYVDNTGGTSIQYDGFTTVLTAEAKVIPCQIYHLKMAIADLGDNAYDSGVFLQANSLTSNAISSSFDNFANPNAPSDLYEGCEAFVTMSRPQALSTPTRINVSIEGDVSNGVDFAQWNDYFYFPANTTEFTMSLAPYQDGLSEGIEYAKFVLSPLNGCPRADSIEFNIIDTEPIEAHIERDTLMNSSSSIQLRAIASGGMPEKKYTWTNMMTGQRSNNQNITVSTVPDARWLLEVEDSCHNYNSDTILIGIRRNFAHTLRDTFGTAPLSVLSLHDTILCANELLDIVVHGADSCVWRFANSPQIYEARDSVIQYRVTENTMCYVTSYLYWNNQYWEDVDSVRIIVIPLPDVRVSASVDRLCIGESVTLTGTGSRYFSWDGGENYVEATSHTYRPDTTTMFVVSGMASGAECYGVDSILVIVDTVPEITISDGGGVCGGEDAQLIVLTTAELFSWHANPPDPSLVGQETRTMILVNPSQTTEYTVIAVNGVCTNQESTTVAVEPLPVAIGEVSPRTVSLGQMEAVFTDLSKNSTTRIWEFPGGETYTDPQITYLVPDDLDSLSVRLWAYNPYHCFDTTTITVYVDHTTLWTPNAFTPDESTNRTFLVKWNDVQRYHIMVYDRRGQLVFESYDPEKPWDGKNKNGDKCPQGVYTFLISCHKITYPYEQIVRKGSVLLIR